MAVYSWRHRATSIGAPFAILLSAISIWVVAYGLEILAADPGPMIVFAKIQYLGIVLTAPMALVVALFATGRSHWLTPGRLAAGALLPLATFLLAATNELHGLIWAQVALNANGPFRALSIIHGPAYFGFVVYSNLCIALATILLLVKYARAWHSYRSEAILVLTGFAAPWVANMLYVLGIELVPNLDLTPFALAVTGITWGAGLKHGLLDVVRVARSGVVDGMSDGIAVIDARGRLIDVNAAALRILELTAFKPEEPFIEALAHHPQLVYLLSRQVSGRSEITLQGEKTEATYELELSPLADYEEEAASRVLVLRDVTERERASAALVQSEIRHRMLFESVPICIAELDLAGRFVTMNPAGLRIAQMLGLEDLVGHSYLSLVAVSDRQRIGALLGRALAGEACEFEVSSIGDEAAREFAASFIPVLGDDGTVIRLISHCQDLTERKRAEERIRSLAFYDALTGLPNRQRFQTQLQRMLQSAQHGGRLLALLFIDLDGFKRINDSLGHSTGDRVLCEVAARFEQSIRFTDFIGRGSDGQRSHSEDAELPTELSRLGGDEFTVVLSDISHPLDASRVARRILGALKEPVGIDQHEVFISASIGIVIYPEDGDCAETLLQNADAAMYDAKKRGRNNYQFYTKSMNAAGLRKLRIENRLRRALESDAFSVYYQPVRDCHDTRLIGAEALLRWRDPQLGQVSPEEFIPIAEESGLIAPIGVWVLRTACAQGEAWRRQGYRAFRMAVNLSAHQIRYATLIETVEQILSDTGFSPGQLELEITESAIMDDGDSSTSTINRLSELGIGLALDDFGTGFSSLSHLRRFPLDHVKIDRSFVGDITESADDRSLTAAIIAMAHGLRLAVVAEGVETRAQLEILREQGCDEVQGYLFSPAVPASEFVRFLEREKSE